MTETLLIAAVLLAIVLVGTLANKRAARVRVQLLKKQPCAAEQMDALNQVVHELSSAADAPMLTAEKGVLVKYDGHLLNVFYGEVGFPLIDKFGSHWAHRKQFFVLSDLDDEDWYRRHDKLFRHIHSGREHSLYLVSDPSVLV